MCEKREPRRIIVKFFVPKFTLYVQKRKIQFRDSFDTKQMILEYPRAGGGGGGGLLPYMGMYRCERHGFQAVYSSIGYINKSVWV